MIQEQREQRSVEGELATSGVWNPNYASVPPVQDKVRALLLDRAKKDRC